MINSSSITRTFTSTAFVNNFLNQGWMFEGCFMPFRVEMKRHFVMKNMKYIWWIICPTPSNWIATVVMTLLHIKTYHFLSLIATLWMEGRPASSDTQLMFREILQVYITWSRGMFYQRIPARVANENVKTSFVYKENSMIYFTDYPTSHFFISNFPKFKSHIP